MVQPDQPVPPVPRRGIYQGIIESAVRIHSVPVIGQFNRA